MSINPRYKHNDKVRPLKESFIYIVDDYYITDDNDIIYITHINNHYNNYAKEFKEEELVFAGFNY